ncbi:hypothetical protein RMATCC62417_07264 [Rhizopus microsporus]|nr:hypothetical protein RMATCC62417_07264 [Rhizopus microsporus]
MTIDKKTFAIMAAVLVKTRGIGVNNALPWNIPGDWQYFEHVTTKSYGDQPLDKTDPKAWSNIVIMGRKSYEASPMNGIPLANRLNIIISKNKNYIVHPDATLASSLEEAFAMAQALAKKDTRIFLLGGQKVYEDGILLSDCTHILITNVYDHSSSPVLCDTFMPEIDLNMYRLATHDELQEYIQENDIPKGKQRHMNFEYEFLLYVRK